MYFRDTDMEYYYKASDWIASGGVRHSTKCVHVQRELFLFIKLETILLRLVHRTVVFVQATNSIH